MIQWFDHTHTQRGRAELLRRTYDTRTLSRETQGTLRTQQGTPHLCDEARIPHEDILFRQEGQKITTETVVIFL